MKKTGLFLIACSMSMLTLAGCNCNCPQDDELSEAGQFCLENSGTYSMIHSQTAVYGECSFPSGITCEDDLILAGNCDFEPNLDDIDTEEERLAGCEENVQGWMIDFEEGSENIVVEWGDESEGGASFIRNGVIKYVKDGRNWTMNAECVADFVDGSLSVSYDEAVAGEPIIEEVVEEEMEEEVAEVFEENTEKNAETNIEEISESTNIEENNDITEENIEEIVE